MIFQINAIMKQTNEVKATINLIDPFDKHKLVDAYNVYPLEQLLHTVADEQFELQFAGQF